MSNYISIQGSYTPTSLALFKGNELHAYRILEGQSASATLVPTIQSLLEGARLTLSGLAFIAVDQGPGAFTSLRATIATANGISFASHVPLFGIDGLETLCLEGKMLYLKDPVTGSEPKAVVSLLNAYNKEVFFRVSRFESLEKIESGYKNIDTLLEELKSTFSAGRIIFVGNGNDLYKDAIKHSFGGRALLLPDYPLVANPEIIAKIAKERFSKGREGTFKISPLYLKEQQFHKARNLKAS